jgi:tyrosyl-tRNA synthetase
LLSHISLEELQSLKEGIKRGDVHPKRAKEDLALEIVGRYHGKDAALKAKEEFEHIFKQKGLPDEVPVFELPWEEDEMWVPKIMKLSGLTSSTGEAVRLIRQGGVTINNIRYNDPDGKLGKGDYLFKAGRENFKYTASNMFLILL